eukprot:scaffold11393_cov176-Isochrysis_galbana.AAC.2
MPVSWPEVLSKLRQLPRPHLAQEAANSSSAGSCAGGEAGAVAGCGADVSSGTAGAEGGVVVLLFLSEHGGRAS